MSKIEKDGLIISAVEATEAVTREGLIIQEKNTIEEEINKNVQLQNNINQNEQEMERE